MKSNAPHYHNIFIKQSPNFNRSAKTNSVKRVFLDGSHTLVIIEIFWHVSVRKTLVFISS